MLSGSLGRTAYLALTGTLADVEAVGLTVGTPVLPMLASTATDVAAALAVTGPASVEYKLDGARVQVHREGGPAGAVRVFTRNLAEITDRVPEVVEVVRGLPGDGLILDGETLSLDEDGRPRPFQETMSRFGASPGGKERVRAEVLRPWFFDVLHADGVDLLDEPLSRRRAVLRIRRRGVRHARQSRRTTRCAAQELAAAALARGPRGGRRQGARRAVCRRSARQVVAQGQAGAHLRPGGAGRRVGLRPPHRVAVATCTWALGTLRCRWASRGRSSWSARRSRA